MAVMTMSPSAIHTTDIQDLALGRVRFLPLSYDNHDSQASALRLILALRPDWASESSNIEFVRFTDGITNTLLKAVNSRPGLSNDDMDREAILLRAYGNGTDVLIDREREAANHELLMRHGQAPELLARFQNGMLYRYVCGEVSQPRDLMEPRITTAIARRLAQWHATIPCLPDAPVDSVYENGHGTANSIKAKIANAAPGKPAPNVWTTMQKWILALPNATESQRQRQVLLQAELQQIVKQLSLRPGYGRDGVRTPSSAL